jgi:hypothetical protein
MATALLVVGLIGAAVSAYASWDASQTAAKVAKYNKKVAKNNATYARQAAKLAADAKAEENRHVQAVLRARAGASGVSFEGSPLEVFAANAEAAAKEEARLLYGGDVTASGYEASSALEGFKARRAETMSYVGAGTTLLTEGASAWSRYQNRPARSGQA